MEADKYTIIAVTESYAYQVSDNDDFYSNMVQIKLDIAEDDDDISMYEVLVERNSSIHRSPTIWLLELLNYDWRRVSNNFVEGVDAIKKRNEVVSYYKKDEAKSDKHV